MNELNEDELGWGCDCCPDKGYYTSFKDLYVRAHFCGCSGTMPREVYDDDPEYLRRSGLHSEVIPLFRELDALEGRERALRAQLAVIAGKRKVVIEGLWKVHLINDCDD